MARDEVRRLPCAPDLIARSDRVHRFSTGQFQKAFHPALSLSRTVETEGTRLSVSLTFKTGMTSLSVPTMMPLTWRANIEANLEMTSTRQARRMAGLRLDQSRRPCPEIPLMGRFFLDAFLPVPMPETNGPIAALTRKCTSLRKI